MNGYRTQNGCHDCAHRFEHDGLFCAHKAIRPAADVTEEKKRLGVEELTLEQRQRMTGRWMDWSYWHQVHPAGTCQDWVGAKT